jgi:glycine/D-amino acid oxidase-like deaminating enzyme
MSEKNLWSYSCAEDFQAPELAENLSADLVIVGGGFTGCAAAIEAAGQDARVVLLEAKTIGFGGSGRNVGLVNAGLWLPPDQVEQRLGQAQGQRLNAALAEGPETVFQLIERHGIACEPVRNGTLHCAHSDAGLADLGNRYNQQMARQAPVHLLDANTTAQATGSKSFFGALMDKRAGTIQPLAYVKGLARAAVDRGAAVFENSPVIAINSGDAWTVKTAKATVKASSIILATNAYHEEEREVGAAPTSTVNFFQLATRPLPEQVLETLLPNNEGCWDTGLVMTSFRKDQAGRFILGAMGLPDVLGIHKSWAQRAMARLFPVLTGQEFEFFWSGRIGMSKDYLPKIQKLGDNGFRVFGYSGRGIGPGTVFGQALAKTVLMQSETYLPTTPIQDYSNPFAAIKSHWVEFGARSIHFLGHR